MKRIMGMIAVVLFACSCTVYAQDANSNSTSLKEDWMAVSGNLAKMADKMPEEDYRFKPVPEIEDFGQRMAHIISFNMRTCAMLKGEQKQVNVSEQGMPSKADIVAAMKEANDECNSLFATLTDADLSKSINMGRMGSRTELSMIEAFLLEHSQEMYGYMAVYLRLKGIVPPSSDRTEIPGGARRGGI